MNGDLGRMGEDADGGEGRAGDRAAEDPAAGEGADAGAPGIEGAVTAGAVSVDGGSAAPDGCESGTPSSPVERASDDEEGLHTAGRGAVGQQGTDAEELADASKESDAVADELAGGGAHAPATVGELDEHGHLYADVNAPTVDADEAGEHATSSPEDTDRPAQEPATVPPPADGAHDELAEAQGALPPRRRSRRRVLALTGAALAGAVLVPSAAGAGALRLAYAGELHPAARTRGRDAVWLGHAWVDGRNDARELAVLRRRIVGTGVRDLYVHLGPLAHDGTLDAGRYPRARWLLGAVRRALPTVRVQGWLGDVLVHDAEGERAGDGLWLGNPRTRRELVASARQVVGAGFDGVHFDLEQMRSGDGDFLRLLDALGPAVAQAGGVLSVAAHQIDPLPGAHRVAGAVSGRGKYWSQGYFGQVARRVDQIAMMSYDTWIQAESLYGGYVAHLTRLALQVTPRGTDLLLGLPFFHTDNWGTARPPRRYRPRCAGYGSGSAARRCTGSGSAPLRTSISPREKPTGLPTAGVGVIPAGRRTHNGGQRSDV